MRRPIAILLAALLAFAAPVPRPSRAEDALAKRKREALERGCAWLKKQQDANGEWDYEDKPFRLGAVAGHMIQGVTALSVFALLKAGTSPKDPAVVKAFDAIHKRPLEHVYAVGCVLLAIEAKASWEPPEEPAEPGKPGEGTQVKDKPEPKPGAAVKLDARDLDLAKRCVEFLERGQKKLSWRYSGEPDEDNSNPQYALLGLDAAERLGIKVSKSVYERCAEYFVAKQEKDGPEVKAFPVTGADVSYGELKKIEKELKEQIRKIDSGFKGKKKDDVDKSGRTKTDQERAAEEEAARKVNKTMEKATPPGKPLDKMFARGWNYGSKGETWTADTTGSMTASGLACLFICKSHLEVGGSDKFEKELKPGVVKALRDGSAWIASKFTVTENPPQHIHHYYYLYGLERAGILGLIPYFGEHDWYSEGATYLLNSQLDDGRWFTKWGSVGPVVDTDFALLFLARGTTPLVKLPERIATGQGNEKK